MSALRKTLADRSETYGVRLTVFSASPSDAQYSLLALGIDVFALPQWPHRVRLVQGRVGRTAEMPADDALAEVYGLKPGDCALITHRKGCDLEDNKYHTYTSDPFVFRTVVAV